MKKFNLLFSLFICLLLTSSLSAQRYLTETFSDIAVSQDNQYAVNETVLAFAVVGQAIPDTLIFDFYEPASDTEAERPLVIYLKTGNFLPIQLNQTTSGSIRDSATVEMATRLAKLGYVVAVPTYRLGWNPTAETQPERAFSLINASYRGIQDIRTCIRYFKDDYTTGGNSFAVDTSRITLWGQGTGGYISLAAATLDRYIEIATTTHPAGKFLTDLDGDPSTLEPMVLEAINGDIWGTLEAGLRDPMTGEIIDLFCRANYVGYSSDFDLCVNLGGALGDISWLEAGDVPMISYHAPNDPFAPYEDATLIVPTTGDAIVQVQGSFDVLEKANSLGNNDVFVNANLTDAYTTAAKAASTKAGHDYQEGLYPFNIPTNQFNQEEGSPWDWWDPAIWGTIEHPSCMGVPPPDCSFHVISLLSNANMSEQRAKTYIDTIIGYFAPRAYEALNLNPTSTEEILDEGVVKLSVSPNPATDQVRFAAEEMLIRSISIFDLNGRLVSEVNGLDANQYTWTRGNLPTGLYVAKLKFDAGIISHKLMLE